MASDSLELDRVALRRMFRALALAGCCAGALPAGAADPADVLPAGGRTVAGEASLHYEPGALEIRQGSPRAVIEWQGFDIGAGARVDFRQPDAAAAALNRVLSADPSRIFGTLSANGRVFLVNPAGIVFGAGAKVDVGALVASTLSIGTGDFMSGHDRFAGGAAAGAVVNWGEITAGSVALLAPELRNQGVIRAQLGSVVLAAGEAVTLDTRGDGLLAVQVDPAAVRTTIENRGMISAGGGEVVLAASAADRLLASAIRIDGVIEADTLQGREGAIVLAAGNGRVELDGELSARGLAGGAAGGAVTLSGAHIALAEGARIDVSGEGGGGQVRVGGDLRGAGALAHALSLDMAPGAEIRADARAAGDGGSVVLWSDGPTRAAGLLAARAAGGAPGLVETSGRQIALAGVRIRADRWLIDPFNVTVSDSPSTGGIFAGGVWTPTGNGSNIETTVIEGALDGGTDVTVTTVGGGTDPGDILVRDPLQSAGLGALSLLADRNVQVSAQIDIGGDLTMHAAQGVVDVRAPVSAATARLQGTGFSVSAPVSADFVTFDIEDAFAPINLSAAVGNGAASSIFFIDSTGNEIDLDLGTLSGGTTLLSAASMGNLAGGTLRFSGMNSVNLVSSVTLNPATSLLMFDPLGDFTQTGSASLNFAGAGTLSLHDVGDFRYETNNSSFATLEIAGSNGNIRIGANRDSFTIRALDDCGECSASMATLLVDNRGGSIELTGNTSIFAFDLPPAGAYGAIDLRARRGNFSNGLGSGALFTSSDRWVVFSFGPEGNAFGGLVSGNEAVWGWNWASPAPAVAAGNRYVFEVPEPTGGVVRFFSTDVSKLYGEVADLSAAFGVEIDTAVINTFGDVFLPPSNVTPLPASLALSDIITGGSLSITSAGSPANADVAGSPYTITIARGTVTSPFPLAFESLGLLTISPRELLGITVSGSKVYDGSALLANPTFTLTGALAGDVVGAQAPSASFDTPAAGSAKPLVADRAQVTLTGADAANYTLPGGGTVSGSGDITRRPAQVNVGGSKPYDGNTLLANPVFSLANLVPGDEVSVTGGGSANFASPAAGTNKPLSASGAGLALAGADAGNYQLNPAVPVNGFGDIFAIGLSVSVSGSKVYDGSTELASPVYALSGLIAGDQVTVSGGPAQFDTPAAGLGKALSADPLSLVLAGAQAGNYSLAGLAGVTGVGDITPRPAQLSVTGSKQYDGTAALANPQFVVTNLVAGDELVVSGGGAGSFDNAQVGAGKPLTAPGAGLALGGASAANYSLAPPAEVSGSGEITPRTLSVLLSGSKVYDGSTLLAQPGFALDGVIGSDQVALAGSAPAANFADPNAGLGKALSGATTGLVLVGADVGNYLLPEAAAGSGDILQRVALFDLGGRKTYDGSADLADPIFVVQNAVFGDEVFASGSGARFDDARAGSAKPLTAPTARVQLSGASAANYRIDTSVPTVNGRGVIDPLTLVFSVSGSKVFDGLTLLPNPSFGVLNAVPGDAVAVAGPAQFGDPEIGFDKPLFASAASLALLGADAANYRLELATTVEGRGNILPLAVDQTLAVVTTLPSFAPAQGVGGGGTSSALLAEALALAVAEAGDTLGAASAAEVQRQQRRNELYASALAQLRSNPQAADIAICPDERSARDERVLCMPTEAQIAAIALELGELPAARAQPAPVVETKRALLIGNNGYRGEIPVLLTPQNDVEKIGELLSRRMGYQAEILRDATKEQTFLALKRLALTSGKDDSVLIVYAGHGYQFEGEDEAYWLPVSADVEQAESWISNRDVARLLSLIPAKQIVLISDSCFSGGFAREVEIAVLDTIDPRELLSKRAVVVLSSGGDEPVSDEGKEGHSVFAYHLINQLRSLGGRTVIGNLREQIKDAVYRDYPQVPQAGGMVSAGHIVGTDYLIEPTGDGR